METAQSSKYLTHEFIIKEETELLEPNDPKNPKKRKKTQTNFCKICCKTVSSHLNQHYKKHDDYYNCTSCYKSFKKDLHYIEHAITHSDDAKYACVHCDYTTENVIEISKHLSEGHEPRYECYLCGMKFTVLSWYADHFNYHAKLEPFECKHCDKKFPYSRHLAAHIAIVHEDTLPVFNLFNPCGLCDKIYKTKKSLNKHVKIVHSDIKPMCTICGKKFTENYILGLHMCTHTGETPFKCKYCELAFSRKVLLQEHEMEHSGNSPFKCNHCELTFSKHVLLQQHKRKHTDEKPFTCDECGSKFLQWYNLFAHRKRHHGVKEEDF